MFCYIVLNSDPSILGVYFNLIEAERHAERASIDFEEQIEIQAWRGKIQKPFRRFYYKGKISAESVSRS